MLKFLYDNYPSDIIHPDIGTRSPMKHSERWRLFREKDNAIVFYSPAQSNIVSIVSTKGRGHHSYPVTLDHISENYPELSLLLLKNIDILFQMKSAHFLSEEDELTFLAMQEKDFRTHVLPSASIVDVRVYA